MYTMSFNFQETARTEDEVFGTITWKDRQFNVRLVNWTEEQERKAAILANKAGGDWDYGILQNNFPIEMLIKAGFEGWEVGHFPDYTPAGPVQPAAPTSIKKMHLFFTKEQFSTWQGLLKQTGEPGTPTSIFINAANLYYADHQDTLA